MAKEYFKNLPDTSTPLTATRFNGLLDGDESQGNLVVESISSKNMFDKDTVIEGWLNNEGVIGTAASYRVSDFIPVIPGEKYTYQGTTIDTDYGAKIGYYNSSKVWVSYVDIVSGGTTITIPSNIYYIRTTIRATELETYQFEKGSTATTYTPYNAYGSSNLKNENIVVRSIRSKNIINTNAFLGMNGASGSFEQLKTGARIITGNTGSNQWANFLLPNDLLGKKCTFSLKASASSSNVPMARIFYGSPTNMTNTTANFDLYGTGLKSKTETFLNTLPSGCTNIYMILYANRDGSGFSAGAYSDFENLQLEIGEEQTSYSPYQDLENQEIYSTGEVKIGTWINGRTLYKKTIVVNSINTNANSINVNHGISNMDVVASIKGAAKITGANEYRPLSCMYINDSGALDSQYLFNVYGITPNQITLSYGNWFKTRFDKAYITLEYTKTTD